MFVNKDQVPEYLRAGTFYKTLSSNKVEVPDNCLKADLTIHSDEDLSHVMHSLHFWEVDEVPLQVLGYVLLNIEVDQYERLRLKFPRYNTFVVDASYLKRDKSVRLAIGLNLGVKVVKYLYESCGYPAPSACWVDAAREDDLPSMKFLTDIGVPMEKGGYDVVMDAACHGGVECLKYLYNQGCNIPDEALHASAKFGRLECIKFLHEVCGKKCTELTMMMAGELGQMSVIQYLHEKGCPWDVRLCAFLASKGYTECLVLARKLGCPWDADTFHAALRTR